MPDTFLYLRCALCLGTLSGPGVLCPGCHGDLPWLTAAPGLAGPVAVPVFAALAYEFPVDRLVTSAKFHRRLDYARLLGELLYAAVGRELARNGLQRPDVILPVPLHRRRLATRGYNQAVELARPLGKLLGVPVKPHWAFRLRPTLEQTGLSAPERRRNLRGAFVADAACAGQRIAVVDDVLTTGSTARALVLALRRAGAADCQVWTASRALL